MGRIAARLGTDMAIRKLKPKPGQKTPVRFAVSGEPVGLYIQVTPAGSKSWLLRVTTGSKPHPTNPEATTQIRREFGLGGYPGVSLLSARERGIEYLSKIRKGIDPQAERREAQKAELQAHESRKTFAECERSALKAKAPGYKNEVKSKADWRMRMDQYVLPTIGDSLMSDLTADDMAEVLKPLWRSKYPTAKKLLHDLAAVFRYAKAKKTFTGENPVSMDALEPLLGKPNHRLRHFPSLPYDRVSEFLRELRKIGTDGSLALEFAILTAARSDEVRSAPWSEFNLQKKIWRIPALRMKRGRDHQVPLSNQAIAILRSQAGNGRAYPFSNRSGEPLSDMALSSMVKRMHDKSLSSQGRGYFDPNTHRIAVPHGFRSSFKDWARALTQYADEVSELALAHVNSDATRAAYARDQLLDLRASLMQEWADYCS